MTTSAVVLGPMIRYADETPASIWVETRPAALVLVRAGGRDWTARTFKRGPAPKAVTFLSRDVHYSYAAEVERASGSRIMQAVCSPIRNPLPRLMRSFAAVMSYGLATPLGAQAARSAKVPDPRSRAEGCLLCHDRSAAQRARG